MENHVHAWFNECVAFKNCTVNLSNTHASSLILFSPFFTILSPSFHSVVDKNKNKETLLEVKEEKKKRSLYARQEQ